MQQKRVHFRYHTDLEHVYPKSTVAQVKEKLDIYKAMKSRLTKFCKYAAIGPQASHTWSSIINPIIHHREQQRQETCLVDYVLTIIFYLSWLSLGKETVACISEYIMIISITALKLAHFEALKTYDRRYLLVRSRQDKHVILRHGPFKAYSLRN